MTLTVQLSFQDVLRANYSITLRRLRLLFVIAIVIILALVGNEILEARSPFQWQAYLWVLAMLGFLFLSPRLSASKLWKSKPEYAEQTTYSFTEDAITIDSRSQKSQLTWNNIMRFRETKHQFLMFVGPTQVLILPLHAFPDEISRQDFRNLLATKARAA